MLSQLRIVHFASAAVQNANDSFTARHELLLWIRVRTVRVGGRLARNLRAKGYCLIAPMCITSARTNFIYRRRL